MAARQVTPKVLFDWPGTTGGNPPVPHPQADPGHPGEPDADRTVLSDFSATATTDQRRVRSFDHPHLTRTDATPA